jgi:hypothetical protein
MLPFITADQFRLFLDGTGKPFTVFVDSVLRAAAARLGIPPSDVHTNVRTNLADGGVDTRIDSGNGSNVYLAVRTLWQFKARPFKDFTDSLVQEEIQGASKEYARNLIRNGYAYRLCICEDSDARDQKKLQDLLHSHVTAVNPDAQPSLVLLPSDIAQWANQYPSVIARHLRLPVDKFRSHESWRASAVAETPTFVATEHHAEWATRIESHLNWSQKPAEVALTLYGNAGVGKTRSLFEILDRLENQRELVLYTTDEKAAIDIATALTNDSTQNAVLVADECLNRARVSLSTILRGNEHRVRLITIDNAFERTRRIAPELHVTRATEQETLRVLEANFDSVPLDRRMRYTRIADGSLRFAVYMCKHDSEILETGNISSALRDAHSYYESRFSGVGVFDTKDREALEIVALVDRLGFREDRENELIELCKLVHRDPQDTLERIEKIRTRMGFIASAGRFYYVTPAPVAMVAFDSAWERWVAPNPNSFLSGLPEDLVQPFQDRVSSASPEVGAVVAHFFRDWTITRGSRILESESETRHLLALVVADPATQVPLLRSIVESASPSQLGAGARDQFPFGSSTPRRLLVSMGEELAQFQEFYEDAEAILLRLALEENEPSIGNNATNTWKGLYRILLSGTEVPFPRRFELLKHRSESLNVPVRRLVIAAAAAAVDRQPIRMVGAPLFGSRLAPQDWRPKTYGDYYDAIENSVRLLAAMSSDPDPETAAVAKKALLDASEHLLWAGYVMPVRQALKDGISQDLQPRIRAMVQGTYARFSSPRVAEHAGDQNSDTKNALDDWLKSLPSETLHAQLVENVASEPWSHHFDEEEWRKRVEHLANQLFADPAAFSAELAWLNSNEAKAATEVGHFVGRKDAESQKYLTEIVDAAIQHQADAFARGYFYGVTERPGLTLDRLNSEIDRIQKANAKLAFFIMLPAGDSLHSFDRALTLVNSGLVPARVLSNLQVWVGSRKTTPQEAGRAVRLLLPLAKAGECETIDVATDFVAYQINKAGQEGKAEILRQIFDSNLEDLWSLLDLFVTDPGREDFWFAQVLRTAVQLDPARGCELASRMIIGDSFPMKGEGEKLIGELAQLYPAEIMEAVGRRITDDTTKDYFFVRKFSFLAAMPFEVVKGWLAKVGVVGARAIARHLQPPSVAQDGRPQVAQLTRFVLTEFEEDERTFSEFVAGVHSYQGYWGSYAEARQKEGLRAKAFLNDSSKRIRQWAVLEMRRAEEDARIHGIREDEIGLR